MSSNDRDCVTCTSCDVSTPHCHYRPVSHSTSSSSLQSASSSSNLLSSSTSISVPDEPPAKAARIRASKPRRGDLGEIHEGGAMGAGGGEPTWAQRILRPPKDTRLLISAAMAEFWGTLFMVVIATGAVVSATRNYNESYLDATVIVPISMSAGIIVVCLVAATAGVSGAHLNPAVTIGFLTVGRIDITSAVVYIVVQVVGAILGLGLVRAMTPAAWPTNFGLHGLADGVTPGMGVLAEIVFTAILMFTIYGVAIDPRGPKPLAPICIGYAVLGDLLFGAGITGASMNPARSLAPAVWTGKFQNIWVYWVGPIIGAVMTAVIYEWTILRTAVAVKNVEEEKL